MKNSLNLSLIILLFVVLGCSCPKLSELANKGNQPPPRAASPETTDTDTPSKRGDYEVTMAKYEQVKIGMKKADVEKIFGGKGEEYYSGKGGGVSFTSVKWVGDNFKTVLVSFRNDKVTSKSQVGLDK
ncbi:MAG: hypothetical protein WBD16_09640 [Pyrinomonadaceae bacterium]